MAALIDANVMQPRNKPGKFIAAIRYQRWKNLIYIFSIHILIICNLQLNKQTSYGLKLCIRKNLKIFSTAKVHPHLHLYLYKIYIQNYITNKAPSNRYTPCCIQANYFVKYIFNFIDAVNTLIRQGACVTRNRLDYRLRAAEHTKRSAMVWGSP